MILRALARWNLKEIKLEVVGSVLNFRKAARRRWIACLHSLLNQGLSRLWIVGLCGMQVLAIFISFLENSGIVSVLFTMRCFLHWERNSSQLALFNLHRGRSSSWGCKLSSTIGKWSLPHVSSYTLQVKSRNNEVSQRVKSMAEYVADPIYQPLRSGRIWHKVNFLSGVKQVWIQSFPSPRLVASPRLKNLVCPTIYP